ncbi:EAL domain-containing protein [Pseudomonas sp. UL073]|uniref:EAL domain-containing protein n=1 Tax=Zestomonas insulae TaxID=2809017 RepID=A0ABS2ILK1_9GAMM|nr:EAL domain-containing protein [Pseudomonas insulae]MBM7062840.1 EAL domain-containing protein [Pseudomonas insulae]
MASALDALVRNPDALPRRRIGIAFYSAVLVLLLLAIGLSGWNIYRDYRMTGDQVRQNISALSHALEGYISAVLQQSYESIRVTAQELSLARSTPLDETGTYAVLSDAMRYDPVSSYLFARREGRLYAVDAVGQPVVAEPILRKLESIGLQPGGTPLFYPPLQLPGRSEFMLPLMIEVRTSQGPSAQIGALVSTERFGQLMQRLGLGADMNAGMVDDSGTVLYRTPQAEQYVGKPLPADSPMRPLLSQQHFQVVEGASIDGQPTLFAISPSQRFPVHAVAGETTASYQLPWLRRSLSNLALLALSLLFMGLVAWQLRRLIGQISQSEQFYRRLFTDISDGVLLLDSDGRVQAANPRAAELFGVERTEQLFGQRPSDLSPEHQPDGRLSRSSSLASLHQLIHGLTNEVAREWRFRRSDNQQEFDCDLRATVFHWQQRSLLLLVFNDITEHKRYVAEQEYLASHDQLTRLPNRYWLVRHIEQRVARAPQGLFAVLLLDMNRFKEVNDTLGHQHGDEVLQELGRRLGDWLVAHDAVIARLGGDEMAIVSTDMRDEIAVGQLCQGVSEVLRQPLSVGGIQLELSASIGVACYPEHADNAGDLLRCADIAMYQAKHGRRDYLLYHRSGDNYTPERLALHTQLGRAIREGGLFLHYQPKVRLADEQVVGFEALLRWQHPEKGLISPAEFIPLAESTELIHPLTHWVLDEALRQSREWSERGLGTRLAINISANNLRNPHFVGELQSLLSQHQVAAELIELEVTEGTLLVDPEQALRSLQAIRDLGVTLSIDDFGTGYSSLAYLKRLPVQVLKIDRTFVSAMIHNQSDAMIVQSTVALGHNFAMQVVAEGVEDAETAAALVRLGCDIAQGYHFGRPMPAEQVISWRLQRQMAHLDLE